MVIRSLGGRAGCGQLRCSGRLLLMNSWTSAWNARRLVYVANHRGCKHHAAMLDGLNGSWKQHRSINPASNRVVGCRGDPAREPRQGRDAGRPARAARFLGRHANLRGCTGNALPADDRTPYLPTIGEDGSGRYWLAWYTIGPPNGIQLVQFDPSGLTPTGNVLTVPDSGAVKNNGVRLALTCAQVCRIVYLASGGRLVSWAPGESAPTLVASGTKGAQPGSPRSTYRTDTSGSCGTTRSAGSTAP